MFLEEPHRPVVRRKLGKGLGMSNAAARILVLLLDELCNRAYPITDNSRRNTLRARHDFSIDHQHAVISSLCVGLDHDAVSEFPRIVPCFAKRFVVVDASRYPATMTGVKRLENDGITDLLNDVRRSLHRARDVASGHGESDIAKHSLGVVLVLRNLPRDRAGVVRER